ncbi:hypothetical protein HY523_00725, partial [Candidatus Berkelbacteria bacterium]|nr:hypothetical protein [Candidatus Berkelbacteria bacterium]
MDQADHLINNLTKLEPAIMEAGLLACDLQATVTHHQKSASGNAAVDIISEADVVVQETILAHVLQTPLRTCRLLAEEDTPLTKEFPARGQFWLTLDPIDGTQKYVEGGDFFRVIIGFHDGHELLYTFIYFPKLDWWIRATRQTVVRSGTFPRSFPIDHPERSVVYNHNFVDASQVASLGKRLESEGYQVVRSRDIEPGVGATTFFISGAV